MTVGLREFVAAVISAHDGGFVPGRTYLQKLCYFVSKLTHVSIAFEPHYYGPYSRDVGSAVSDLVSHGIVEESCTSVSGPASGPFPAVRYTYRLLRPEFLKESKRRNPRIIEAIASATRKVLGTSMADSTNSIAVAAKVHSILEAKQSGMTVLELLNSARKLGWKLSPLDVTSVVESLRELGLVA